MHVFCVLRNNMLIGHDISPVNHVGFTCIGYRAYRVGSPCVRRRSYNRFGMYFDGQTGENLQNVWNPFLNILYANHQLEQISYNWRLIFFWSFFNQTNFGDWIYSVHAHHECAECPRYTAVQRIHLPVASTRTFSAPVLDRTRTCPSWRISLRVGIGDNVVCKYTVLVCIQGDCCYEAFVCF